MNKSPPSIQLLPQEVIERIKAGEVVQKPAAAVKELVENALDAGSTEVIVQVSTDCLREISVHDNGCGISDLALAVQRHTTSKLHNVDDLSALQSFGFRGEALASIVQATGRVHIVSRTIDHPVAFQQSFSPALKQSSKSTPCARKPGTTVTLHDLFATMKQRQKMTNDYPSILQLLQNYAVLYASRGISFVCQKLKKAQPDLNTGTIVKQSKLDGSSAANTECLLSLQQQEVTKKVLVHIHGSQLIESLAYCESKLVSKTATRISNKDTSTAKLANNVNLSLLSDMAGVPMQPSIQEVINSTSIDAEICSCKFWCLFTKPSSKQMQQRVSLNFILFINSRLVECAPLKKRVEECYSSGKNLVFLAIEVPPQQVDVNIHPTKKLVALLFQHEIIEHISAALSTAMKNVDRGFTPSQVLVPSSPSDRKRTQSQDSESTAPLNSCQEAENISATPIIPNPYKKKPLSSKRVRTHHTDPRGSMEPFLSQDSQHESTCPLVDTSSEIDLSQPGAFADAAKQCTCRQTIRVPRQVLVRPKKIPPSDCTYKSIAQLRKPLREPHPQTLKLRTGYHVGIVSPYRSLIQCGKELVLLNHHQAAAELFYQIALLRFGGGAAVASLAVSVDVASAVQAAHRPQVGPFTTDTLAEEAAACIWDHAEMLQEYFSIILAQDRNGRVVLSGLPILLEGWEPMPHGLPLFLLRLATKVNWAEEKPCFDNICRELGWFYAELPLHEEDIASFVRHSLFPAVSSLLSVSSSFVDEGGMVSLTSLDALYRIFERC